MTRIPRLTRVAAIILAASLSHVSVGAQFVPAVKYDEGLGATSLAVGDINGDGAPDIVVGNPGSPQHIRVLANTGTGTFQSFVTLGSSQFSPRHIVLADVDNNGHLDIVWTDMSDLGVYVLLGSGTTIFAPVTIYPAGSPTYDLSVVDATGDGILDVLFLRSNDAALLVGVGDGTFQQGAIPVITGAPTAGLAVGDVNEDGSIDFATVNPNTDEVIVLLSTGVGGFSVPILYPVGSNPSGVALGDVNGDGHLDLVVSAFVSHDVTLLIGDGRGAFVQGGTLDAVNSPIAPRIADFDGDSVIDIAVVNRFAFSVSLFRGTGSGRFEAQVSFPTDGAHAWEMQSDDLDDNGIPDLVIANGSSVSVLLASANECGVVVSSAETIRLGEPPNPGALQPGATSAPVIGKTWDPFIDHSVFMPGAFVDILFVSAVPENQFVPKYGTLLCSLSGPYIQLTQLAGGVFSIPVPVDCTLVGVQACVQGASVAVGSTAFTNALDIVVGTY